MLITAGPTHEPIDAVRYLANRSSGRMGVAIAVAAANRDLPTTLLLGPTQRPLEADDWPPNSSHTALVRFQTAADLQRLLAEHWPQHDVLIMAAAVADFRPTGVTVANDGSGGQGTPSGKIRRTGEQVTLDLEPTPDLLADLASITRQDQTVIGFALEPADQMMQSAEEKLQRKRLDAIVANPLETMDAQTVTATLLLRDGSTMAAPPAIAKRDFAEWLLDAVSHLRSGSLRA